MKTLSELSPEYWLSSNDLFARAISHAERVTEAYERHEASPAADREAAVLSVQFPELFQPMQAGDVFAGRVCYPLVGLSPEPINLGYYCSYAALQEGARHYPQYADRVEALITFWRGKTTAEKVRGAYPDWVAERLPSDAWQEESGAAFPLYRMAGSSLNFPKLLQLGLDGLERELQATQFTYVVPLLQSTIGRYLEADPCADVSQCLKAIRHDRPQCFREAIQLFWLFALHSGTWNYGRLDVALGSFLKADLDSGRITWDEALEMTCALWRLMHDYDNMYDNRLIIGGRGRDDADAADLFALLAIEATRKVRLNQPQLSFRFDQTQNPELWAQAIDAIGEGCTFPMLYNDDVNIPAVMQAFGVDEQTAEQYTPYGCGEYVLNHYSEGSPNGVINLLKVLELCLHQGVDINTDERLIPDVCPVERIQSFDDLWSIYQQTVEYYVEALALQQKIEYDVMAKDAPLGFISALTSDCIERDCSAFGGGARYLGGCLETYGNTNTADSLHVIDELVFKQKRFTLRQIVTAMDANFEGYEAIRDACKQVSKYGNDEGLADSMARRVHEHICQATAEQGKVVGLDSYLVVVINNWANTVLGWRTCASADGRQAGQPMANANNPSPGSDINGVTAFLNSLVKLDPSLHAGSVQNMKFSKEWFGDMRPKFEALLKVYFARGGSQAMITVVSRSDMEAAMREPEKWGHLMVRVGGFSIRFIDLARPGQLEVLARTLN
ncbi:pyruvate formate lyase family protein [Cerasicoccus maritimus]|uniref:pyruvate formate lyase family protein n=1 Tax=Cerasicoccus maritimus TaxID=490089 RepID=UPI002852B04A|nr:pyruvate formate lyase family protein [Cerasicoccus maritimus]